MTTTPEEAKREAAAVVLARIHLAKLHVADVRRCDACGCRRCATCEGTSEDIYLCVNCERIFKEAR